MRPKRRAVATCTVLCVVAIGLMLFFDLTVVVSSIIPSLCPVRVEEHSDRELSSKPDFHRKRVAEHAAVQGAEEDDGEVEENEQEQEDEVGEQQEEGEEGAQVPPQQREVDKSEVDRPRPLLSYQMWIKGVGGYKLSNRPLHTKSCAVLPRDTPVQLAMISPLLHPTSDPLLNEIKECHHHRFSSLYQGVLVIDCPLNTTATYCETTLRASPNKQWPLGSAMQGVQADSSLAWLPYTGPVQVVKEKVWARCKVPDGYDILQAADDFSGLLNLHFNDFTPNQPKREFNGAWPSGTLDPTKGGPDNQASLGKLLKGWGPGWLADSTVAMLPDAADRRQHFFGENASDPLSSVLSPSSSLFQELLGGVQEQGEEEQEQEQEKEKEGGSSSSGVFRGQGRRRVNRKGTRPPDVFIIVLDSTSRGNFMRMCPRTADYLTRLSASSGSPSSVYQFFRYSSIAWGTTANVGALFSGCTHIPGQGPMKCVGDPNYSLVNLTAYYKRLGYAILGGDFIEEEAAGGRACAHGKTEIERQVEMALALRRRVPRHIPTFLMLHNCDNHIGGMRSQDYQAAGLFDRPLRALLESLDLDNSLVHFVGDHGSYSTPNLAHLPNLEKNNPVNVLVLPKSIQKAASEQQRLNLHQHQQALVTHFDMHLFFKQLPLLFFSSRASANGSAVAVGGDSFASLRAAAEASRAELPAGDGYVSVSLLDTKPTDRTCGQAGAMPAFCFCTKQLVLDHTNSTLVRQGVEVAIQAINAKTGNGSLGCQLLSSRDFHAVGLLQFDEEKKSELLLTVASYKRHMGSRLMFKATFTTDLSVLSLDMRGQPVIERQDRYSRELCVKSGYVHDIGAERSFGQKLKEKVWVEYQGELQKAEPGVRAGAATTNRTQGHAAKNSANGALARVNKHERTANFEPTWCVCKASAGIGRT